MKKLLCAIAVSFAVFSGLFAEGGLGGFIENNKCERPVRIEADLGLAWGGVSAEVRGAYMFRITDTFRWDLGLGLSYSSFSPMDTVLSTAQREENEFPGGDSINTILFASFWFGDWYTTYGFGFGINTLGGAAFIPADLRIGWQPGSRKNNRCAFKLEFAALGSTVARYRRINNGTSYVVIGNAPSIAPRLNLGMSVRL